MLKNCTNKQTDSKFHNSKLTDKRIELKSLMPIKNIHSIEASLRTSKLAFLEAYPQRRINSLYFDTPDFHSVSESFSGISTRAKYRFRWYGKIIEAKKPTYEVKFKRGHLSWKSLTQLKFSIDNKAASWNEALLDSTGTNASKIVPICGARPVSIVSYLRKYYVSADRRIRVTLDTDLCFLDQTTYSSPNFLHVRNCHEKFLVEIKLQPEDLRVLKEFKNSMNFIPQRFSKYCESLANHLPFWK